MQDYVITLLQDVEAATPALLGIGEEASARRSDPNKWSPREVLGHLIDSASNNHGRFVRGQRADDLCFEGYDQNAWVAVQRYQEAPWSELVTLWASFNRHLARVMAAAPLPARSRPHARHNLDAIGWQTFAPERSATLDDLMSDYVAHLEHHLKQILGTEWRRQPR